MWSGIPAPAAGWFPQVSLFNRPLGGAASSFTSPPFAPGPSAGVAAQAPQIANAAPAEAFGFGTGPLSFAQPPPVLGTSFATGLPLVSNPFGVVGAPFPGYATPEIAAAFSISSLLAAVAQRRGQPMGPTTDQEIEDFIYDALEWLNGASDVEVRCEGARVTLTGSVQHKRLKRDVGEIAWAIPGVNDVQNTITITARRRSRPATREAEPQAAAPGRKQT
jgi:hypothetical protein